MGIKNFNLIVAGFLLLLTSAYIDNVRGPLMPFLKDTFNLAYGETGRFIYVSYPFAILSALMLNPLFNRYGVRKVSYGICALGLVTFAAPFLVESYVSLILFGILLGATISTFGTLSNVLVMQGTHEEGRTRMLCALHMMYGAGSFVAPLAFAAIVSQGWHWRLAYVLGPPFFVGIVLLAVGHQKIGHQIEEQVQSIRLSAQQWLAVSAITFYVGSEVVTSMWMISYLQDVKGLELGESSVYLSGFFLVLFLSRLVGLVIARPERDKTIYWSALVLGMGGLLLGQAGYLWGFSLAGTMGVFFPVYLGRVSQIFTNQWRSITVWCLVLMQVGLLVLHFGVGEISDKWGLANAYWTPVVLMGAAMVLAFWFERGRSKLRG